MLQPNGLQLQRHIPMPKLWLIRRCPDKPHTPTNEASNPPNANPTTEPTNPNNPTNPTNPPSGPAKMWDPTTGSHEV